MYRRKYYTLPKVYSSRVYRSAKYSNETVAFNAQVTQDLDGGTTFPDAPGPDQPKGLLIVPATNVLGNRKVKNFTIRVTANLNDDQIFGALVYVPEGTEASRLLTSGSVQSLYEPNQNVIATFVIPPNCLRDTDGSIINSSAPTQITVSNRLARNLNTGDHIALIFGTPNGITINGTGDNGEPCTISGTVNYAIKY